MAYGVDLRSFYIFAQLVEELELAENSHAEEFHGVFGAYISACQTLFSLEHAVMSAYIKEEGRPQYLGNFLPIFENASDEVVNYLTEEIGKNISENSENAHNLLVAIKKSYIAEELRVLGSSLDNTAGQGLTEEHFKTATVATNSIKEFIKKYTNNPWIEPVLHTLNEVIQIVSGRP